VQLTEQRLRFPQIERIEPFGEPAVDRSEQFASLLHLALVAPEACEAGGGTQLERLCALLSRVTEQRDFPDCG
jgi:hypothetical protein